jgi:hypothetical protein
MSLTKVYAFLTIVLIAINIHKTVTFNETKEQQWKDYPALFLLELALDMKYNISHGLAMKSFEKEIRANSKVYLDILNDDKLGELFPMEEYLEIRKWLL